MVINTNRVNNNVNNKVNNNVNNKVNNKVLTPKKQMIMGYDENNNKNEWYQNTFKDELHILNNNESHPPPPYNLPPLMDPPNVKIQHHNDVEKHKNRNQRRKVQPGIQNRVNKFNNNTNHNINYNGKHY